MDVLDYCKGMEMELTAWKAKLYDLTRKVDKLSDDIGGNKIEIFGHRAVSVRCERDNFSK